MNNVNMGGNMPMVPGPPVGPAMPMMANGGVAPPAGPRPQQINEANKHLLNTYIYEYFLRNDMLDCARALLSSDPQIKVQDGPNVRRDENGNLVGNGVGDSMDVDSKDGIDAKGAEGLPLPSIPNPSLDNPFLYEWFCLFWDMFNAQKGKSGNVQVNSYMNHTQNQSRLRQSQTDMLRNIRPDMAAQQQQLQIMRMQNSGMNMAMKQPNNIAQRAMANNQNNPQMMQVLHQQKQGQMQRDPSDMDGNRARQSSPGSAENAPSPSKRPHLDGGAPFNPAQQGMMPNGRPGPAGQGMPGQQVGPDPSSLQQHTMQRLLLIGINPAALTPEQFANFQNQSPAVQQKTIQTYAHNLQQQQSAQMPKNGAMPNANGPPGQGSPMVPQGPNGAAITDFYNAEGMGPGSIRPGTGPGAAQQPGGSNHALQDYQMQLMLLEQQNKKRLMMARQEQDGSSNIPMPREGPVGPVGPGGPGGPPGAAVPFQGASPQGARPGASPNPNEMKRPPPQMNPAGMGSPMAEGGQSRGSPNNSMFMGNQMDPNQAPHFFKDGMNGMAATGNMPGGPQMNGMRPPSSHPQPPFNGPMNPAQQQMMVARQGQMAGPPGQQMQWQQQQGGPNGNPMVPQGQTPQQVQGTPRQSNAMPPPAQPAAAAAVAANARNTSSPQVSNAAPPTPSTANKPAPKKKDTKNAKDKKKSNPNLNATGATPVSEPATEAEAPTPTAPITPVNSQQNLSRPGQNAAPAQAMPNGQAAAPVPPQAPAPMVPPPDASQNFSMDGMGNFDLEYANPLASTDVLNDFDFDSFLHDNEGGDGGFDFTTTGAFMDTDGIET